MEKGQPYTNKIQHHYFNTLDELSAPAKPQNLSPSPSQQTDHKTPQRKKMFLTMSIIVLLLTAVGLGTLFFSSTNYPQTLASSPLASLLPTNSPSNEPSPTTTVILAQNPQSTTQPTSTPSPTLVPTPTPTSQPTSTLEPTSSPTPTPNPTMTPTPTPTPSPTPPTEDPNPPIMEIIYPEEGQEIVLEMLENLCVIERERGGNTTGLEKRYRTKDSSWSSYTSSPACFLPVVGDMNVEIQYRNEDGETSPIYERTFTIKLLDILFSH